MKLNKYILLLNHKILQVRFNLIRKKILKKKLIWHVCTPKSASTYFMNYMTNNLNNLYGPINPVSFGGERDGLQNTCPYTINSQLNMLSINKYILTSHQHAEATYNFFNYVSDKHKIIVQTRGILDTIVSLIDHLNKKDSVLKKNHIDKNFMFPHTVRADIYWENLSEEKKIDFLILNYLPWHLSFLRSWLLRKEENIFFINYDEVIDSPNKVLNNIFLKQNIKEKKNNFEKSKINFNLGIKGRGFKEINEKQINKIKDTINRLDIMNQNLISYL